MNKCSFCSEINRLTNNNLFLSILRFTLSKEDRILFETDNFIIIPSLGALVPGHLLIVSKLHYISIGHCPASYYSELEYLVNAVRIASKIVFKLPVIAFEHGASVEAMGGSSIDHTHLHVLPIDEDVIEINNSKNIRINDYYELKKQYFNKLPYLYYQSINETNYLIIMDNIPSQYLRQVVAAKLGIIDVWNWKLHHGLDNVKKTMYAFDNNIIGIIYESQFNQKKRSFI